jgi:hypothetical protein
MKQPGSGVITRVGWRCIAAPLDVSLASPVNKLEAVFGNSK